MNRNCIIALGTACLVAACCVGTALAAPAELPRLRALYEAHLAQFESEYSTELEAWRQGYRKELGQLVQASQRAGNLEVWQTASREAARFETEPAIPEESAPDVSEAVKALQARNRPAAAECLQRRYAKVDDLTAKYAARLDVLKTAATRAGSFDEAIAYDAEIKRVSELPVVLLAKASMRPTASAAETPSGAGTPSGGQSQPPASVPEPEPAPDSEMPDGVVINEGMTPAVVPGMSFKPMTLSVTDRMRVARSLSVRAELASSAEMERSSYVRSGSMHHVFRLGIRPSTSSQTVEGAVMVVEFYGKSRNTRAARVAPQTMGAIKVPLPRLSGTNWTFIQLPRVSADQTTYRSSYYYYSSSEVRYGLDFYGGVISIFDATGVLLYQAVSAQNLLGLAPAQMPDIPEPATRPVPFGMHAF